MDRRWLLAIACAMPACSNKSRPPALGADLPSSGPGTTSMSSPVVDAGVASTPTGARVLFVGNSHTQAMLPDLLSMVDLGAPSLLVDAITVDGAFLRDHAANAQTLARIRNEGWNIVVFQEQQVVPALPEEQRATDFLPPLEILVGAAAAGNARAMLFMTYARKNGDDVSGYFPNDTYDAMQARLLDGFRQASNTTGAALIPVAYAWDQARAEFPQLELYQPDGIHPSADGACLAAAVAYASISRRDPSQLAVPGEDPASVRPELRRIAATTEVP